MNVCQNLHVYSYHFQVPEYRLFHTLINNAALLLQYLKQLLQTNFKLQSCETIKIRNGEPGFEASSIPHRIKSRSDR